MNLSRNAISSLDEKLFKDTVNLTSLDLSHNKIRDLDDHIFDNLFKIKHINLSHNYLEILPLLKWDQLTELKVLDVSYNKFGCVYLELTFAYAGPFKTRILINSERIKGDSVRGITCTSESEITTEQSAIPTEDPWTSC